MTAERKNAADRLQWREAGIVENIAHTHAAVTAAALQVETAKTDGLGGVVVALARARRAVNAAYGLALLEEVARRRGG